VRREHSSIPARRDQPGPPAPSPGRRFPAGEIDTVLRRAAKSEQSPHVPAQHNLTVAELMEVAREVGLDPLAVRRSASIEKVGGTGALAAILGAPDRREVRADHARGPAGRSSWLGTRGGQRSRQLR